MELFELNLLRALVTLAGICCFIAIVVWAYSKRARAGFEAASRLPFDEEETASTREDAA